MINLTQFKKEFEGLESTLMEARLKNEEISEIKHMKAINKQLEISNSLTGLKIQTFRKGISKEKSNLIFKKLTLQEILGLYKMHQNISNFK